LDRCALFVDASYALADGALAVHGTRNRDSVSWDYAGLLKLLGGLSRDRAGVPLLRCYWYDVATDANRAAEHDTLADIPGVKLRLSKVRPNRKEGVEAEIRKDLTALARNRAVSDVIIVSAEEDLAPIIAEVQDLGVRTILLHIAPDDNWPGDNWAVSRALRQECDDIIEIAAGHLRPYVDLISGAEPRLAAAGYREVVANSAQPSGPHAAIEAPAARLYASPVAAEYEPAAQPQAQSQPAGQPQLASHAQLQALQYQQAEPSPSTLAASSGQGQAGFGQGGFAPQEPLHGPNGQGGFAPLESQAQNSFGQHVLGDDGLGPGGSPQGGPAGTDGRHVVPVQNGPPSNGLAGSGNQGNGLQNNVLPGSGLPAGGPPQHRSAPVQSAQPPGLPPQHRSVPAQSAGPPAPPPLAQAMPGPGHRQSGPGGVQQNGLMPLDPQRQAPPQRQLPPGSGPQYAQDSGSPYGGQVQPAQFAAPPSAGGYGTGLYGGPQSAPLPPVAMSVGDAVQSAHAEGFGFGEAVARDAPALWLEAVLARKPRMPSDLEARLLQGSALPIDSLLHDEVRHALRRGFWDALERSRR
jgi:NYN domain